jgi:hypothetical protein
VHPAAWAEVLVIRPEESASPALQRFRVPACTPGPVSAHEAGPVKCACAARTDEPYALSDEPVGGVVALSFHAVRPHRRQRTTTSPCPGPLPPCRGMGSLKSRSSTSCHTFQQSSSLRWRPCPYRLPESGYTMGTGRQPRPRRWWGSRHLVRIRVGRFCGKLQVTSLPPAMVRNSRWGSGVVRGRGRRDRGSVQQVQHSCITLRSESYRSMEKCCTCCTEPLTFSLDR